MVSHKNIEDVDRHEPKGASTASAGQLLSSKGDGTTEWVDQNTGGYTFLEEKDLTSQASVTFTGIPSTAKTIRVVFYNANRTPIIQLGDASSIRTTGYLCDVGIVGGMGTETDGFHIGDTASTSQTCRATVEIQRSEANLFVVSGAAAMDSGTSSLFWYAGSYDADGIVVDRVRVTSDAAFASGSVAVFYQ